MANGMANFALYLFAALDRVERLLERGQRFDGVVGRLGGLLSKIYFRRSAC